MNTEICPVCQKPVPDDDNTVYRVLMPEGLSHEVIGEAMAQAEKAEEEHPSSEQKRNVFKLYSFPIPVDENWERVHVGRAMVELGAWLIAMHPECAEKAKDLPNYYRKGEGWGQYE